MTEQEAMTRFDFIRCALLGGTKPEIIPNEVNVELMDIAIKALEEQIELKKYIDECKSCGRGSAVEFLEKYLVD